jgi:hypothetical protein
VTPRSLAENLHATRGRYALGHVLWRLGEESRLRPSVTKVRSRASLHLPDRYGRGIHTAYGPRVAVGGGRRAGGTRWQEALTLPRIGLRCRVGAPAVRGDVEGVHNPRRRSTPSPPSPTFGEGGDRGEGEGPLVPHERAGLLLVLRPSGERARAGLHGEGLRGASGTQNTTARRDCPAGGG